VAAVVLLRRRVRHQPADALPTPRPWHTFWSFAAARGAAMCFEIGVTWLDVILIAALRGPREAGIYAAASRFITAGTLGLQATRIAISPQMAAALAKDDRGTASELYSTSTVLVTVLSWPVYLSLAVFAPDILQLF